MPTKSIIGGSKKYSGVVDTIKKNSKPEEKINKDQVIHAFKSFNIPLNNKEHDDILFWTSKDIGELPKLINELSTERKKINQKVEEDKKVEAESNKAKSALPRLSDNEIKNLYDEFGLNAPNYDWARNHLPNDTAKIRSILEMQRKFADSMIKKHTTNTLNSIPDTPKYNSSPAPMSNAAALMTGKGGPGDPPASPGAPQGAPNSPNDVQGQMTPSDAPVTPFFTGDHAIIRIVSPNNPNSSTLWLADPQKKVLRPFVSEAALRNAFEDPDEATKSITNVTTQDFAPGKALYGFKPLKNNQGVQHDGTMPNIPFSHAQVSKRYNKPSNPQAEQKALSLLDGIFSKATGK